MSLRRRDLLKGSAAALAGGTIAGGTAARAGIISGELPWQPDAAEPPEQVRQGPWHYFTTAEAAAVEALADRIIPPDPQTPGGKDAGCAVYIDRQLAGPYGREEGLYTSGPFLHGEKNQGPQSQLTPAQTYRKALAALDKACEEQHGKVFAGLSAEQQDAWLAGLEQGSTPLPGGDGKSFFEALVKDVQQGFFADPVYGGNKDMCAWKMIGFPGARYDYRDWIGRHNQRFPLPPVSIYGRDDWTPRKR